MIACGRAGGEENKRRKGREEGGEGERRRGECQRREKKITEMILDVVA